MTREQAVALHDSKFWEALDPVARAEFQLQEARLCMPFDVFHAAVEKALGRPVWTHEFGDRASLLAELHKQKPPRTMQEILDLIPAEKRLMIVAEDW